MEISEFEHVVDFPTQRNVVYVIFYAAEEAATTTPFYVGETQRFNGRMADYSIGAFAATADFKVGEAIRYLTKKGYRVRVGYNECSDRTEARAEERRLIELYSEKGIPLLNKLIGFDYRVAEFEQELMKVHDFCSHRILGYSP